MASLKNFKIGIVDDNISIAVGISNSLEFKGFKTFQVYDANDVVQRVKEEKPDLVLLDLDLHKKTGLEVAKELPKEKIFIMTGYDLDKGIISKLKNIVGVIPKPIDDHVLFSIIGKELNIPLVKSIS